MLRVLIVDDSRMTRKVIRDMLSGDPEIRVVGEAEDGQDALDKVLRLEPSIVTMDIVMPRMNGLEAITHIMAQRPTPILVVTSLADEKEINICFKAIKLGALEVVRTPEIRSKKEFETVRKEMVSKIKLLSRIRVITHHLGKRKSRRLTIPPANPADLPSRRVVAIGASTGGPSAITTLLSELPENFPASIVLVQHISEGFSPAFGQWLEKESSMPVKLAEDWEPLQPGIVYISGSDKHIGIRKGHIRFSEGAPVNSCRPSIDLLFKSVADEYGPEALGVLLTGMGKDGAEGCKAIQDAGGFTLVQDESTSLVYGMPQAAIALGAATVVLPLAEISERILRLVLPVSGTNS
ncbi:MAG: chemotaxis response regulator protein-glutamate methylesterase [Planctomycetota bacterium]|nr:chemotaxis response regulator protein-glutamate methylesterase [Planctomycetota bacterium]